jgi:hypothetical protein
MQLGKEIDDGLLLSTLHPPWGVRQPGLIIVVTRR